MKRIKRITFQAFCLIGFLFVIALFVEVVFGVPISGTLEERLGNFTGPITGTAQDDTVKASLDLAHTDLDSLITTNNDLLAIIGERLGVQGSIFYVDSGATGSANGTDWTNAEVTVEGAVANCTADAGDIIVCAPGHSETMTATNIDLDVAGITLIGLGNGELRTMFDFDTATDEFTIGADDIHVYNVDFKANVTDVTKGIDIETGCENYVIDGCRFYTETTGTDEFTDAISTTANCDNGRITNCRFEMGAGGADAAIQIIGNDYTEISDNIITGDYATACVEDKTTASVWLIIKDNILFNGTVGGTAGLNAVACISLKADTAALIINNSLFCNVADPTLAVVAADGFLAGNTYCEAEGTTGSVPLSGGGRRHITSATTSGMGGGDYQAADDPTIFTVTGDIMCRAAATFSTQITSTSSDTLELGVPGNTAALLVQDVADGTAFDVGDTWTLITAADADGAQMADEWLIVSDGDIVLTINDNDLTAGVATFYLEWIALSDDAAVVDAAP